MASHPNLLVGLDTRDDAGVYKLNDETALIQTMDFFTPMVDDPFTFGQIAATNALNDIYAMGGKPLLAMNIVCFPECEDFNILKSILAGGLSKIEEAGAFLVGGHTVDDNEPKYGLSVTGIVHPQKLLTNANARAGDVLLLTKPIGNGIIATAIKADLAKAEEYNEATKWMTMLNKDAVDNFADIGVNAVTDITGFGLLGHLFEMAYSSNVQVKLFTNSVPYMSGVYDYASMGLIPGGAYTNRDYLAPYVETTAEIDPIIIDLLYTPETAGGLLISVPEDRLAHLIRVFDKANSYFSIIGRVVEDAFSPIKLSISK